MFDLNVLRLGALFNFYIASEVGKEKVCKCKELPAKFRNTTFCFGPGLYHLWKRKSGRPAGILCSNKEPVTGTCRIPLALTLQGKNKEPPTGRLQNMSKHGKLIMARKIPCQRSYKANSSGIRIKLRKHNRVKGVVAKHREGQKAIRGNSNNTFEAIMQAKNRLPK